VVTAVVDLAGRREARLRAGTAAAEPHRSTIRAAEHLRGWLVAATVLRPGWRMQMVGGPPHMFRVERRQPGAAMAADLCMLVTEHLRKSHHLLCASFKN
jgi:hypothetical protein